MINVRLAPLLACFALLALRPDPGARTLLAARAGALLSFAVAITAVVELRAAMERELGGTSTASSPTSGSGYAPPHAAFRFRFEGRARPRLDPRRRLPSAAPRRRCLDLVRRNGPLADPVPTRCGPAGEGGHVLGTSSRGSFATRWTACTSTTFQSNGDVDPFGNAPPGPSWRRLVRTGQWRLDEKIPGTPAQDHHEPDRGPCAHWRQLLVERLAWLVAALCLVQLAVAAGRPIPARILVIDEVTYHAMTRALVHRWSLAIDNGWDVISFHFRARVGARARRGRAPLSRSIPPLASSDRGRAALRAPRATGVRRAEHALVLRDDPSSRARSEFEALG